VLYFVRELLASGSQAINNRDGYDKIYTYSATPHQPIEIMLKFLIDDKELNYGLQILQPQDNSYPVIWEELVDGTGQIWLKSNQSGKFFKSSNDSELRQVGDTPQPLDELLLSAVGRIEEHSPIYKTFQYITRRWQMLDENFMPTLSLAKSDKGSIDVIDRCGDNVVSLLQIIESSAPELHQQLMEDAHWLMNHIDKIKIHESDYDLQLIIQENNREAATISSGTARNIAILTALYLLDVRLKNLPGLAVIEEPDSAIHPLLLSRLVELFRMHVDSEFPRQVFLTTHNPQLLNLFSPEEVRIVERIEGITQIKAIDPKIWEIWQDDFQLGDVWKTRVLGGVPE
jgi:predicted ATPase